MHVAMLHDWLHQVSKLYLQLASPLPLEIVDPPLPSYIYISSYVYPSSYHVYLCVTLSCRVNLLAVNYPCQLHHMI